ncbi:leucine-rich repeat protein, partial [Butyrivibrio sp. WCD3002]|uniref:leucine-rich repeat protein n=1 Tax=Butyrivibrio sp. WCD3002 TaxID=1280676 RepID=UPI0012DBE4CC
DGNAFAKCTMLEEISYPKSLESAGDGVFAGDTRLTAITVPEGVTKIAKCIFSQSSIKAFNLPSTLTEVGESAFAADKAVTSIELPEGVKKINNFAFENCTGLTDVTLHDGLTEIGYGVFKGCSGIKKIELPDSITTIDGNAFGNCTALAETNYPLSLKTAKESIYAGDKNLQEIKIPEGVTKIADNIFSNSSIRKVDFSSTVTAIGASAFEGDIQLSKIEVPDTVTTIGNFAFSGCEGLRELTFGKTVNKLGYGAVKSCKNLKKLTILNAGEIDFGDAVFYNSPITMYCYPGSPAMHYAITNGIPVCPIVDESAESFAIDNSKSYYMTNSSDLFSSGYIDLVVSYCIKDEVFDGVSDTKLSVVFPSTIDLKENSVTSNNQKIENYVFDENHILTIPVSKKNGVIHFTVVPRSAKALVTSAVLKYKYEGADRTDAIGVINEELPTISIAVPTLTNTKKFTVNGIAPASSKVTLYVDGVKQTTVTASKGGKYKAGIELTNPVNGQNYTIKAEVSTEGGTVSNSADVRYSVSEPVLTGFKMYYRLNGNEREVDLLDTNAMISTVTFAASGRYSFHVTMTNPDLIKELYVTSTRNGVTSKIPARYNESMGCFITSEKFNDDKNYVPASLSVEYTCTDEYYNRSDVDETTQAKNMVDDYIKENPEVAKEAHDNTEVVSSDNDGYDAIVTLESGAQVELSCEQYSGYENVVQALEEAGYRPKTNNSSGDEFEPKTRDADSAEELIGDLAKDFIDNGFQQYFDSKRNIFFRSDDEESEIWVIVHDQDVAAQKWVQKKLTKEAAKGITEEILNAHSNRYISIDKELSEEFGFVYSAGSSTIKYFGKMWELDMRESRATSEAERREIAQLRDAMTTALLLRYFAAGLEYASDVAVANPLACIGLKVAAFLINDMCDQMEEYGYAGISRSYVGMALGLLFAPIKWIIDPSGYVYEAVTDNRISGATATVYYKDTDTGGGTAVSWNAAEYDQYNPQTTGGDGTFAWDVPEGLWKVVIEKDGYETAETAWLDVPPPQTGIGIRLKPTAIPKVTSTDFGSTTLTIEFSQYMKPETFTGITLKDEQGQAVAYNLVYDQSKSDIDGIVYANKVQLVYSEKTTGTKLNLSVPATITSGYDAQLESYSETGTVHSDVELNVTDLVNVKSGESIEIPFEVTGYNDSLDIVAAAEYTSVATVSENISIAEDGKGTLIIKGLSDGETEVKLSVAGMAVAESFTVVVGTAQGSAPVRYAVSFYGGKGTEGVAPSIERQEIGAEIALPENTFTLTGKAFSGWTDGTKLYQPGDKYTVTGNVTFTATWEDVVISTPVTGVTLNKAEIELSPGYSETLTATIAPANASNKNLKWESSNTAVAVVTSTGTVTAVAEGEALITVKSEDGGFSATCKVKVAAKSPAPATNGQTSESAQEPQQEIDDPTLASVTANKTEIAASKLKKKNQTVTIKVGRSKGKITAKNASSGKLKKYLTVKVKGRKVTCTLKKGAKKGVYKVKVTVGKKGKFKKTVKTVEITVK